MADSFDLISFLETPLGNLCVVGVGAVILISALSCSKGSGVAEEEAPAPSRSRSRSSKKRSSKKSSSTRGPVSTPKYGGLKLDRHHASDSEDSEDEQPAAAAPKASAKNRARREKKKAKATAAVRHDAAEADTFSEDDDEWQEVSAKKSRRADAGEDKTE